MLAHFAPQSPESPKSPESVEFAGHREGRRLQLPDFTSEPPGATGSSPEGGVIVYTASDDVAADLALAPILSSGDRAHADRRRAPEARRRSRIGRGLLRLGAGRLLGAPPQELRTGARPGGAPYVGAPTPGQGNDRGSPGLPGVSVTHTRGLVAAAASADASRIGVDVEALTRRPSVEAMARRYFDPVEARQLLALPEHLRVAAFLRLWTLKEAWGKAAGFGVPKALSRVAFEIGAIAALADATGAAIHEIPARRIAPSPSGVRAWRLWSCATKGFVLAIAAGKTPLQP